MKKIAIIGGGAAGMMAAVKIAENLEKLSSDTIAESSKKEFSILLFEKNPYLGAKVIISGGGRCNVTTGILDVRELLKNYPRGAKFLMTAMYRFSPKEVIAWFESHGVALKTEDDLRVFPQSDNGKDVVGALQAVLQRTGVHIECGTNVTQIKKEGSGFRIVTKNKSNGAVAGSESIYDADFLVLTTGGNAYRQTGSTGDGYSFAKELGHTITPLGPSLNSLTTTDSWIKSVAGVSIEKAQLTLMDSNVLKMEERSTKFAKAKLKTFERTGAFVFTHHGVSGPAIFALSSFAAFEEISVLHPWRLCINFLPNHTSEAVSTMIDNLITKNPKKQLVNLMDTLLPKSIAEVFCLLLSQKNPALLATITASHLSREHRQAIAHLIQEFPITISGRAAGEEFVSAGGVATTEVNTNTMESKICPNLFFAGELLDIDGFTGGFNLQASWATGALAGEEIAKRI